MNFDQKNNVTLNYEHICKIVVKFVVKFTRN